MLVPIPFFRVLTSLSRLLFASEFHSLALADLCSHRKKTPLPESAREVYTDWATSSYRRNQRCTCCHVVSVTDPYARILGFLDRSRNFFFQVVPQLYSRGWVNSVPDPLLLRKSRSAVNRTRTSGSVARNSDHWITEAVYFLLHNIYKLGSYLTGSTIL
jgi:hypothetical protein